MRHDVRLREAARHIYESYPPRPGEPRLEFEVAEQRHAESYHMAVLAAQECHSIFTGQFIEDGQMLLPVGDLTDPVGLGALATV